MLFIFFNRKKNPKVVIKQPLLLSLVPYQSLFRKYIKKDRSQCLLKSYVRPNLPHLCLCWHLSRASFHRFTYILQWSEVRVLIVRFEKNLNSRNSQVYYAMLNDTDSKRFFQGHNLHPRVMSFAPDFSYICIPLIPSIIFWKIFSNLKGIVGAAKFESQRPPHLFN